MGNKIHKVAVTGTKGKTTVVNLISQILRSQDFDRVLHVDTTGHFVNGVRKSTLQDSQRTWGLVPSVAPGRYLYELIDRTDNEKVAAVLETSLGSSTLSGMGYAMHHVGIFLNVFEDHIGSSDRISSQADIVEAKKFVVKRILRDGFAVLNADDENVMLVAHEVPTKRDVYPIFFGLDLNEEKLPESLKHSAYVTLRDNVITHVYAGKGTPIVNVEKITWTFDGAFKPSLYNALAAAAGIIALYGGMVPEWLGESLGKTQLDRYGGRLTRLRSSDGVEIIADYAHEKKSLTEVARLARNLAGENGKVIGVVRLAYDRTDELIKDTGTVIAKEFDQLVVYDKIDGYLKQPKVNLQFDRFTQEIGKVSKTLTTAITEAGGKAEQIIREDQALEQAAKIAQPGDVVVAIVNDDIERSIGFMQKSFKADFV